MMIGGCFRVMNNKWRAVVSRLTEFNKSMDVTNQRQTSIVINEHDHNDIVINNLKLSLPDSTLLLNKVNLTFHSGGTFLLSGQSGFGKSTLLRAIAKLWPYGEGEITTEIFRIVVA